MKKYFHLDESPVYKNKYIIYIDSESMPFPNGTSGSYNVLPSRILNLTYGDYLRFCRDILNAELIGKKSKYVTPYFDDTPEVKKFVQLLNIRMNYILNEIKFPYEYKEVENGEIERIPFSITDEN